jgi:hypothetical protein
MLTNSMVQGFLEKPIFTYLLTYRGGQKILCFYETLRSITLFTKTSRSDLILSHLNPGYPFIASFCKVYFNINFLPTPRSPNRSLPLRFSDQNIVYISHLRVYIVIIIKLSGNRAFVESFRPKFSLRWLPLVHCSTVGLGNSIHCILSAWHYVCFYSLKFWSVQVGL